MVLLQTVTMWSVVCHAHCQINCLALRMGRRGHVTGFSCRGSYLSIGDGGALFCMSAVTRGLLAMNRVVLSFLKAHN